MGYQASNNEIQLFCDALCSALTESMTAVGASSWQMAPAPDALRAAIDPGRFQVTLAFDGNLHGELVLELDHAGASVATALLGGPSEEPGGAQSQALLRLIDAGATSFCTTLLVKYGAVNVTAAITSGPVAGDCIIKQFIATDEAAHRIPIVMSLGVVLATALGSSAEVATAGTTVEPAHPTLDHVNLDLVLDVELDVTLRFGQRLLTLREVLDLTSGSVIELDRQVEEPVELLLEGKVIARGEAVVIDGNYGLRVTDVPRPLSNETLSKYPAGNTR
jgi:flagellar motor switch protein FliN